MENEHIGSGPISEEEARIGIQMKAQAQKLHRLIAELEALGESDQRAITLAKTNLQQGFMWLNRSIVKPEIFW